MRRGNLISGLLLLALGGYVIMKAKGFPDFPDGTPGPGDFPVIVAGVMVGLVVIMLIGNLKNTDITPVINFKSADFRRVILVAAAVSAYVALLEVVGFLIATPVALLGTMLLVNREGILPKVIATGLTTAALYGIFQVLLKVPLP